MYLKEKIAQYADNRDFPGGHGTSVLSVHFAAGTLSARYAVCKAKEMNKPKSITTGSKGIVV